MKPTIVVYTDNEHMKWAVVVPEGTPEEDYADGIVLGPPDLSVLGLKDRDYKRLHNALVENNFYEAPQFLNRRSELVALLKKLGLPETLDRSLISLYQVAYYGF